MFYAFLRAGWTLRIRPAPTRLMSRLNALHIDMRCLLQCPVRAAFQDRFRLKTS